MKLIQTVTVGAGGQANLDFTSIPQTFTDLVLVVSGRFNDAAGGNWSDGNIQFNGAGTTNHSGKLLYGQGTGSAVSINDWIIRASSNTNTASTFGGLQIYISNYAGSTNKTYSIEYVSENNATGAIQGIVAGLWSNTAAITSIRLGSVYSTWAQYTTASLYGITNAASSSTTVKASGGNIYVTGGYVYHVFTNSGTFTPSTNLTADVLVVAGGGGGAFDGGGGAGGLQGFASQALASGTGYTVTVGSGGAAATSGNNSSFGALTASVGGGRGGSYSTSGTSGGSGGGGGGGFSGGSGTSGQGYAGGGAGSNNGGGGGGGAGGVGASTSSLVGGNGGPGTNAYSSWATATGSGVGGYFAGGGGGGGWAYTGSGTTAFASAGGTATGGGGAGGASNVSAPAYSGTAGFINTGGGGGGGGQSYGSTDGAGAAGGSGIVIVRYA